MYSSMSGNSKHPLFFPLHFLGGYVNVKENEGTFNLIILSTTTSS